MRIYGDFSGKQISVNGIRDTDGSGGIAFYDSSESYVGACSVNDDGTDGYTSLGPFDNCAYIRMNVGKGTTSKSRTTQLTRLYLDGVNVLYDLCLEAKDFFGL